MGLSVMLDAHSNLQRVSSFEADFAGFQVLIDSRENFPFVKRKGFQIKTGHLNQLALTATKIDADVNIYSVDPEKRKCKFSDENEGLTLYKGYSQANCHLEREIIYAHEKMSQSNLTSPCTPWYLPRRSSVNLICDPWAKEKFEQLMYEAKSKSKVKCLPDCRRNLYHPKLSAAIFSRCDERNVGISDLCDLTLDCDSESPNFFGKQVLDEYNATYIHNSDHLKCLRSSIREISNDQRIRGTFHSPKSTSYDAFEKDIAILQVFFDTETIIKFETVPRLNWVGFISNVGGLLGLCLGFSIFSLIEMICLTYDIFKFMFKGDL